MMSKFTMHRLFDKNTIPTRPEGERFVTACNPPRLPFIGHPQSVLFMVSQALITVTLLCL
jgi:hypothetical protein